jgi:hypothetical protein
MLPQAGTAKGDAQVSHKNAGEALVKAETWTKNLPKFIVLKGVLQAAEGAGQVSISTYQCASYDCHHMDYLIIIQPVIDLGMNKFEPSLESQTAEYYSIII